jgi:2,4-dienoyl-CoA reductase-like NADH-dependent reductase (Old Yellow Enzyme family)
MSSLIRRVLTLPHRSAQAAMTPAAGTAPAGPVDYHAHGYAIYPGSGAGLTPYSPLITSDGAPIPATGPGQWDQLYAAGRIR